MPLRAVLFDLDGTLVQTREASWELFERTNREFNLGIDDRQAFFDLFRENFFRALAQHCPDTAKLAAVKGHFLELLRKQYTPALVPGLADVVHSLAGSLTLVVLSTNTIATIRRILTQGGIAHCFAHVFAGDVEPDKSVSMRRFLADAGYNLGRRCEPSYDELDDPNDATGGVALVTDTVGDVKEAKACGVRAIGVAWGMHTEAELLAAGAETVAVWPQELIAWLKPDRSARGNACSTSAADTCACDATTPPGASCGCATEKNIDARVVAVAQLRRSRHLERTRDIASTQLAAGDGQATRIFEPVTISRAPPAAYERELLETLRLLHHAST